MLTMIKIELSRAIKNKMFIFALMVGCAIVTAQFIRYPLDSSRYTYMDKDFYPVSVFQQWIGAYNYGIETYLYFLIAPILATLPYGDSFFSDKTSGYIKNVFIRTKKSNYYISKYIATFVVGGIVVVLPLLLNLYLTTMSLPSIIPQVSTKTSTISSLSMWYGLYYNHPLVYVFLYLLLDFFFFGLIATIALSISNSVNNKFVVLLSPFLYYVIFSFILRALGFGIYDPSAFLVPYQPYLGFKFSIILAEGIMLFIITFCTFYIKGVRDDAF